MLTGPDDLTYSFCFRYVSVTPIEPCQKELVKSMGVVHGMVTTTCGFFIFYRSYRPALDLARILAPGIENEFRSKIRIPQSRESIPASGYRPCLTIHVPIT